MDALSLLDRYIIRPHPIGNTTRENRDLRVQSRARLSCLWHPLSNSTPFELSVKSEAPP